MQTENIMYVKNMFIIDKYVKIRDRIRIYTYLQRT